MQETRQERLMNELNKAKQRALKLERKLIGQLNAKMSLGNVAYRNQKRK